MTSASTDPVVLTDRHGRAYLPHGLGEAPTWVRLRVGDEATELQKSLVTLVVDEFDAEWVGFRAIRGDTGQALGDCALQVRLSVR